MPEIFPKNHKFSSQFHGNRLYVSSPNQPFPGIAKSCHKARMVKDDRFVKACSHCHKKGHVKEVCFKLQDCSYCGFFGHIKEQCYKLGHFNCEKRSGWSFTRERGRAYTDSANNADMVQREVDPYSPLEKGYIMSSRERLLTSLSPQMKNGIMNMVKKEVMNAVSDNESGLQLKKGSGLHSKNRINSPNLADFSKRQV